MSHSLGLKYSGGGGGGAITCFEDTTGSPAKATAACEAIATTVKAINFFITIGFPLFMAGRLLIVRSPFSRQGKRSTSELVPTLEKFINPDRTFLLDFGPIRIGVISVGSNSWWRAIRKARRLLGDDSETDRVMVAAQQKEQRHRPRDRRSAPGA